MILIDTSVWIDHLHQAEPALVSLLERDEAAAHPQVIEELALGSMHSRATVLGLLENLHQFPALTHSELMTLVDVHTLWGRGLSGIDVQLLGSVLVVPGSKLWTWDKRLLRAGDDVGVNWVEG